ncbi:MAG: MBL fold metallo-hydrolase [SAR324 cluster bacterium]|nr:MBL fold metallo-hydrolase [SAR324 cluster bacterium]
MNTWQIGDVKVTRVIELEVTGGSRFILPDATPERVQRIRWLFPHFMNEAGKLIMSIHALIVETPEQLIMVDTCLGNDKERLIPGWNMRQGSFLQDIAAAGYPRESFDTVLCTHLHVDHVGWNTMLIAGQWKPTFSNAQYLFGKKEWEYWKFAGKRDTEYQKVMADSIRPIFDSKMVKLVEPDYKICHEVWLEPTPGHTPGHVSVRISSGGEDALITGDCIHHPCQIANPEWGSSADHDRAEARRTRSSMLERYTDTSVLIIGTHFATPASGYLRRDKEGYRLKT